MWEGRRIEKSRGGRIYLPSSDQESTRHDTEENLYRHPVSLYGSINTIAMSNDPYVELGVTLGALFEVSLLHLRGAVEAARRRAEERGAGKSPARGHSSNGSHCQDVYPVSLTLLWRTEGKRKKPGR